jgi:hypothetical protein
MKFLILLKKYVISLNVRIVNIKRTIMTALKVNKEKMPSTKRNNEKKPYPKKKA